MELRHLRYYVAVAEALSFTKAAARLRVAQPALSRQMQSLEEELGVDLMKRGPRGVTLTAGGKLFLDEAREVIARSDESVNKVRALARGEYGELRIGYAPSASVEFLPRALAAFKKGAPHVKIVLHDLSSNEMAEGLRRGTLELSIMVRPTEENAVGLGCELLKSYPFCVALPPRHPLARLKQVSLSRLVHEPLVSLRRSEYSDFHRLFLQMFAGMEPQPRIVAECDSGSSLFTEVQAGHGLALLPSVYRHVLGSRLELRPLTPRNLPTMDVVVGRAAKGDLAPAAEKFLRELLRGRTLRKGSV
jgi:DNA-binding transcriptional LysR family regulator